MRLAGWAFLWTALVALTCAPAFAQGAANDNGNNHAVQYVDCSQVQVAVQNQYGNANADAGEGEGEAIKEIAQKLNISQEQVNACLGGSGSNDGDSDDGGGGGDDAGDDTDKGDVIAGSVPETKLPNTGGPSLLVVAGLALVAGASLIRLRL